MLRKIVILTAHVIKASKNDIVIPISFIGVMIIRLIIIIFNTFVMLWITSFVDSGVIKDEEEAKDII